MNSYNRGKLAELIARLYMFLHGYVIIARNYIVGRGTTAGEIDFIAKRGNTLVFVEVKQRADVSSAAYAIKKKQQQRLLKSAEYFIKCHPQYSKCNLRFDAILITFPCSICHIKNAWQEESF